MKKISLNVIIASFVFLFSLIITASAQSYVTPMVKGGYYHTIALKDDGTVWTWGYNGSGRLDDGTTTARYTPVQVSGLAGVITIAGEEEHTTFKTTHAGS